MSKKTLTALALPLFSLLAIGAGNYTVGPTQKTSDAPAGTLQKMIVENGSVTIDLDLTGLNPEGFADSLVARPITLRFAVGANSFFPILVFNDLLVRARINGPGPTKCFRAFRSSRRIAQPSRSRKTPFGSRV